MPRAKSLTISFYAALLVTFAPQRAISAPEQAFDAPLLALRGLDARLLAIGDRLALANAELCGRRVPISGLAVHDLAQYGPDYREAAARLFGLGAAPAALAVDPGGAAARAGVEDDDVLLSADGVGLAAEAPSGRASFASIEQAMDRLDAALSDGKADLEVNRAGQRLIVHVQAPFGCQGRFQLVPGNRFNAGADGRYIQISTVLTEYAAGDDELAAVLAHELAHNILEHRRRLDEAGISRGMLKQLGRNARLIRATEVEADRLSIYLLDRAGYDPAAAARFWIRFGPDHGHGIFADATHPRWKQRVAILSSEVALLTTLKQSDPRPFPPLLRQPLPVLD